MSAGGKDKGMAGRQEKVRDDEQAEMDGRREARTAERFISIGGGGLWRASSSARLQICD